MKTLRVALAGVTLTFVCGVSASAAIITVDLSSSGGVVELTNAGSTYAVLDATQAPTSVGTGSIDSFLRVQANRTESGFNTDANVNALTCPASQTNPTGTYNAGCDDKGGGFTHSLQGSDLALVANPTLGGQAYSGNFIQLLLDINENKNATDQFLSLDQVNLYKGGNGSIASLSGLSQLFSFQNANDCHVVNGGSCSSATGTGGVQVLLNYSLNSGSGNGFDMSLYIPVAALFDTYSGSDFLTLYSAFGALGPVGNRDWGGSDGIEEWARVSANGQVPEPSFLLLLGLGIVGAAATEYRNHRRPA
jgi:PEP-CTERM motif